MSSATGLAELGKRLHARLSAGDDPIVTHEITEAFLPLLLQSLRRQFSNLSDDDLLINGATDALLNYFDQPANFVPDRGSLTSWLNVCARNNLLDALKQQKNRSDHEKAVELADLEAVYQTEAEAEISLIERNDDDLTWQRLRAVTSDPLDLKLLWLMMEGVRDTQVFAEVLGIASAPIEVQRATVKQHKDRLKKMIQRHYKRER
ncbi:MAG: sigma-70 family RNA polymerase sigma factor [Blastocatellia bacterium]|nr:sigma-70 family RNA polymerase sigma factor [Blastocatellia bacterium]